MATQYSLNYEENEIILEFEREEMRKKLRYSLANFSQVRFKRQMEQRMIMMKEDNK